MIKTMQKRIEEIKQADRKAYYELANKIGISEYSLYNFMINKYSTNTEEKISKFLKDYKTKDEQIEQWKHKYEVLDACCELAQGKIAELKAENEKLIEGLGIANKYVNKYHQTLQEIKGVAGNNIDCKQYEIDHDCFNDTRCKALRELIETLQEILDLITKAEEE